MPVDRQSLFSYACNACGRCCRDKVITLSPYDLLRIARAAGVSTAEAVRQFTVRRGSILKFRADGGCIKLAGVRCAIHDGRPLACRLYPLGLERGGAADHFIGLEPAAGSLGVYGREATIDDFLAAQGTQPYLDAIASYAALIPIFCARIVALVDFERSEPREFWRCARREAMAESGYDPNPLIDALYDADRFSRDDFDLNSGVEAHLLGLVSAVERETDGPIIAAAATMLAISLGYSPAEVTAITSARRKTSGRVD